MNSNPNNGQKKLFESPNITEEVEMEDKSSEAKFDDDLVENLNCQKNICSSFVVVNKNIRTASSGREYIALTDKTGQIDGRVFPDDGVKDIFDSIVSGGIYKCEGRVNEFPH